MEGLGSPLLLKSQENSPKQLQITLFLVAIRTALLVFGPYRAPIGDPVCNQQLQAWVLVFEVSHMTLCLLDCSTVVSESSDWKHRAEIWTLTGLIGWSGYGIWLLCISGNCDEELWLYVTFIIVVFWVMGAGPVALLVYHDCLAGDHMATATIRRVQEAYFRNTSQSSKHLAL